MKGKMQVMPSHEGNDVENFFSEGISLAESVKTNFGEDGYPRRSFLFSESSDLSLYKSSQKRNLDVSKICHSIKYLQSQQNLFYFVIQIKIIFVFLPWTP